MKPIKIPRGWLLAALAIACPALAKPVFVAETPGQTRFYIDDTSLRVVRLTSGSVLQATVLTRSAPDPSLVRGQVAAEGVMQFKCGERQYRQWSTVAINKDGTRKTVVEPRPERAFSATREGSFERKILDAACRMGNMGR